MIHEIKKMHSLIVNAVALVAIATLASGCAADSLKIPSLKDALTSALKPKNTASGSTTDKPVPEGTPIRQKPIKKLRTKSDNSALEGEQNQILPTSYPNPLAQEALPAPAQPPTPVSGMPPDATKAEFYLVTATQGAQVFEAFGHAALEIDLDGNDKTPNRMVEFAIDFNDLDEKIKGIEGGLKSTDLELVKKAKLELSTILKMVLRQDLPLRMSTSSGGGAFTPLTQDPVRKIYRDKLILTTEQKNRTLELLKDSLTGQARGLNFSNVHYKNTKTNCASTVRDLIFPTITGTLEKDITTDGTANRMMSDEEKSELAQATQNDWKKLTADSMTEAANTHPETRLILVSPTMFGLSPTDSTYPMVMTQVPKFNSGDEVYSQLRDGSLAKTLTNLIAMGAQLINPVAASTITFTDEEVRTLTQVGIDLEKDPSFSVKPNRYERMALPNFLREDLKALKKMGCPESNPYPEIKFQPCDIRN